MKKRLLACLMSVSMVFTLMYGSAVAAEGGGQEKIEEAQEKQEVSTPSVLIVVYANCDMYSPVYMGS